MANSVPPQGVFPINFQLPLVVDPFAPQTNEPEPMVITTEHSTTDFHVQSKVETTVSGTFQNLNQLQSASAASQQLISTPAQSVQRNIPLEEKVQQQTPKMNNRPKIDYPTPGHVLQTPYVPQFPGIQTVPSTTSLENSSQTYLNPQGPITLPPRTPQSVVPIVIPNNSPSNVPLATLGSSQQNPYAAPQEYGMPPPGYASYSNTPNGFGAAPQGYGMPPQGYASYYNKPNGFGAAPQEGGFDTAPPVSYGLDAAPPQNSSSNSSYPAQNTLPHYAPQVAQVPPMAGKPFRPGHRKNTLSLHVTLSSSINQHSTTQPHKTQRAYNTTQTARNPSTTVPFTTTYSEQQVNRAIALLQMGEEYYEQALIHVNSAITSNPQNVDAYACKSEVLRLMQKWKESFEAASQALAIDPGHIIALLNNGLALTHFCDYNNSLVVITKVLKMQPYNLYALRVKIDNLYNLGDFNAAMETITFALQNYPGDPVVLNFQSWIT